MIMGSTNYEYNLKKSHFQLKQNGCQLFVADGLFNLHYAPTDVVFIGDIAHSVTNLRSLNGNNRKELERFSIVMSSQFLRGKSMKQHKNDYNVYMNECNLSL